VEQQSRAGAAREHQSAVDLNDAPTEIEVTLLLCDAAQSIGGKLYILGGGWSQAMLPPGVPIQMALAIRVLVPWTETNRQIPFRVTLLTDSGQPVDLGAGPIEQMSEFELGRPPGATRGMPLDAMMAINAGVLPLPAGSYVWRIEVDGDVKARAPFRILNQPPGIPMGG
jgi:hypothetical protein